MLEKLWLKKRPSARDKNCSTYWLSSRKKPYAIWIKQLTIRDSKRLWVQMVGNSSISKHHPRLFTVNCCRFTFLNWFIGEALLKAVLIWFPGTPSLQNCCHSSSASFCWHFGPFGGRGTELSAFKFTIMASRPLNRTFGKYKWDSWQAVHLQDRLSSGHPVTGRRRKPIS